MIYIIYIIYIFIYVLYLNTFQQVFVLTATADAQQCLFLYSPTKDFKASRSYVVSKSSLKAGRSWYHQLQDKHTHTHTPMTDAAP